MASDNLRDIKAFLVIAQERSFTRAAAKLGVSQSALSHTIRALETRLGLRLLTRTTRSVSPTEAGERLIARVAPRFEAIREELLAFEEVRDKPSGTVRITASEFAINKVLWPKLAKLRPQYPEVKIELAIDPGLVEVVTDGFDAGVRSGAHIAKGMTAVRISPDIRMAVVGAPSYLKTRALPKTPSDLTDHDCINVRPCLRGEITPWQFRKGEQGLQVRVEGSWTFNSVYQAIEAARSGSGLAYVPQELARPYISSGSLQVVLKDWRTSCPGLHIFYGDHRQSSPALSLIVEALRYRH
ncbi:DNA-binding transcriptional LysR family regulator [Pseudomonas hunanensis]|uniref:DNA-binding transcriptional LysR family regulator n=1 Tax=Pseudomonas hunanensis TaxID=1247546 RepID=A0ACC6K5Z5_9PSED|nr:LysR family transcriptional regulator [Pseudomonas hunanensis]MDR6713889.1 DNA-binding transcriptional LysR family regulator [Pseudomonas hunanensis]